MENLRINHLATPTRITTKYKAPIEIRLKRSIELIRDHQISHRLEQLSLPLVRSLMITRKQYKPILKPKRFQNLNMNLQKSMYTLYSRLANVKMSVKKETTKWSENDWKAHSVQIKRLSTPRKVLNTNYPVSVIKPIDKKRLVRLATPRKIIEIFKETGAKCSDPIKPVAKAALEYEPSENLMKLATQIERLKRTKYTPGEPSSEEIQTVEMYTNPYDIPRQYQKVKSVGLAKLMLARNPRKKYVKAENASNLFEISPNVLKHKASDKTKKLAVPRPNLLEKQKTDCFSVNKKALKTLSTVKQTYYNAFTKGKTPFKDIKKK